MTAADSAVRPEFDVVVVGFGPVGQTLAILLAQRGHRVAVAERWGAVYPKPRAVTFDDEVARVFAAAGIADQFSAISEPARTYEWRNAAGATLLRFPFRERGGSGWPEGNMVTQPLLEEELSRRAAALPGVTVLRSVEAVDLVRHEDRVDVVVRGAAREERLTASWVVGCDGANSFVRERMDTTLTDLGFFYDWLICDVVEHEPRVWDPDNLQVCDPQRPTTMVSGGPGRRRWEFLRMPGDDAAEFDTDSTAWRLLAASGVTPDNSTLEKRAVYTFQARWADRWQDGRVFLAGDAAHLMPPFAGQGMCSGIRDAANLAWKLDLVLRGTTRESLLATYASERSAHVRHAIMTSVELGKVICATDPDAVAGRDAHFLTTGPDPATALPPLPPARLGPGVVDVDATGELSVGAGLPGVQGLVRDTAGRTALLDELVGAGFHLLADGARVTAADLVFDGPAAALLADLEVSVVRLVEDGDGDGTTDLDGAIVGHLRRYGHAAVIVRPDGYVFGGAARAADLPGLLARLGTALGLRSPSIVAAD